MHISSRSLLTLAALAILGVSRPAAADPTTYTLTDLGTLGGTVSAAEGLSPDGTVVGFADKTDGTRVAALWANGAATNLGLLTGASYTWGLGVNSHGIAVGFVSYTDSPYEQGFVWQDGKMMDIGSLSGGAGYQTEARAINASNQIVGNSLGGLNNVYDRAFVFQYDTTAKQITSRKDLGTFQGGNFSVANFISDNGLIVGNATLPFDSQGNEYTHAFLYTNGVMKDLGTLPKDLYSSASSVNNSGIVVGNSSAQNNDYTGHAFLYDTKGMHDLGTLTGGDFTVAKSINSAGTIVGYGNFSAGSVTDKAFIYQNGVMTDLSTLIHYTAGQSTWTLTQAYAINDAGQIVGLGGSSAGQHGFLLTPYHDTVAPVTTATLDPSAPNGSGGFYVSPVQVTLSATDEGLGVASTVYTLDNGAAKTYTAPFTVSAEGTHLVTFHSTDKAGNVEAAKKVTFKIDAVAPVTTAAVQNGTEGAQITLTAADDLSGVASTLYTVDDGAQHAYGGPLKVTSNGAHTVHFFSTDRAGNVEKTKTATFTTAVPLPVTTAALSGDAGNAGWYRGRVTVTLSVKPGGLAVAGTNYSVDGGAAKAYAGPFAVSGDGTHSVTFFSTDRGGNAEKPKTVTFKIDTTPPNLTFGALNPAPNANGYNHSKVSLPYTASDALSGIASATPAGPLLFTSEGAGQTITVTVTDKAGNSKQFISPKVNIDLTKPVTTATTKTVTDGDQVSLAATDNLSGVADRFYAVDGGAQQSYTAPFTVSRKGTHKVTYHSTDKAGNVEEAKLLVVTIT